MATLGGRPPDAWDPRACRSRQNSSFRRRPLVGHWSAEPVDAGIEAVAGDELRRVRRLLNLAGRDDMARGDDLKLLRDLRLLAADDKLTRAGLLLLGEEDEIARHIPLSYGYAYQYRSTPGA